MTLGSGALAVCGLGCLSNCSTNNISPINVDFIIDTSQSPYTALQNVGGSITKDAVIIARTDASTFVAVAKACTHEGTTVNFESANSRFHCPNHGANFSLTGTVTNGPANQSLQKFNTTLTGTQLRIFS